MTDHTKLRELATKATPGPWRAAESKTLHRGEVWENGNMVELIGTMYCGAMKGHGLRNAEYIAAVSPDVVLKLLDENERLRADRDSFANSDFERQLSAAYVQIRDAHVRLADFDRQLSAVTAARDEACDIAAGLIGRALGQGATDSLQIAELRKAGSK